jgi:hypothetical protein
MSTRFSVGKVRRIYEFIKANQHLHRVETVCRLLDVARSALTISRPRWPVHTTLSPKILVRFTRVVDKGQGRL